MAVVASDQAADLLLHLAQHARRSGREVRLVHHVSEQRDTNPLLAEGLHDAVDPEGTVFAVSVAFFVAPPSMQVSSESEAEEDVASRENAYGDKPDSWNAGE